MSLMLGKLFDALREAGAPDQSARAAAEEVAEYENRLLGIESKLVGIEARILILEGRLGSVDSRLALMTWAMGINVAVTLAVLAKLLTLH
jgi:hypothetical protein